MAPKPRPPSRDGFEIAIICALRSERNAIEALLEEEYETDEFSYGKAIGDANAYTTGRLGNQHVVLAYMPGMGPISAAAVAANLCSSFERIKVGLVVGICGGVPMITSGEEIVLGDVIISTLVTQIDFGGQYTNKIIPKKEVEDTLGRASPEVRSFIGRMSGYLVQRRLKDKTSRFSTAISTQDGFSKSAYPGPANDVLYPPEYRHKHQKLGCLMCDNCRSHDDDVCDSALKSSCEGLGCDVSLVMKRHRVQKAMGIAPDGSPMTATDIQVAQKPLIHFGRMACSNQVMKSGLHRDRIAAEEKVIGFEMESGGTWDYVPTIVIKSVCDYADSHKNKEWQDYAAATAAACAKAVLEEWRSVDRPIPENYAHHVSAAIDLTEIPPSPSALLPFRRDAHFVKRGVILSQIHERSSAVGSRTALVGLGGIGKSQLAIEYCYQVRERSPHVWVFWVHASNAARFEQSYREIADLVKIPESKDPQANIFKLVRDWLRDERRGGWVLVLDNVDDASFLLDVHHLSQKIPAPNYGEDHSVRLVDYLPQSSQGSILITTRTRNAALRLVEEAEIIVVDPMDETAATMLLEKKLGSQADGQDLLALARELEFMPLAMVQAAAYISERAPRYSIPQYIEKFRRSDKGRTTLLNHEGGHLRRDRDAKNSIIITWQISFDHICNTRPSAADLLSLMSFFDRQGIPEAVLRHRSVKGGVGQGGERADKNSEGDQDQDDDDDDDDHDDDSESDSSESDEFEKDVLMLKGYSFITLNVDSATFEIHSLVQLAMRTWLTAHGQLERWKQQYVKNLAAEFPVGEHENWVKCQTLFPHAKAAVSQQPNKQDSVLEWASLLYRAAWYAWRRGHVTDAATLSITAMKVRMKALGTEHEDTLSSMGMVGLAYSLGGRWPEAEELEAQVMETRKRVLGVEHPSTLTGMANLATTYLNQGRWTQAEELEVQVMETRKRVLGVEHPDTLTGMANLAATYRNQGRWTQAEELEVQVMETRKRVLGVEHPDTLSSMANLAATYQNQGRWTQAEELEVQVMETSKRVLGVEHPSTLSSMANLAFTMKEQGRNLEAVNLMAKCVQLRIRVLGDQHPDALSSSATLAEWGSVD